MPAAPSRAAPADAASGRLAARLLAAAAAWAAGQLLLAPMLACCPLGQAVAARQALLEARLQVVLPLPPHRLPALRTLLLGLQGLLQAGAAALLGPLELQSSALLAPHQAALALLGAAAVAVAVAAAAAAVAAAAGAAAASAHSWPTAGSRSQPPDASAQVQTCRRRPGRGGRKQAGACCSEPQRLQRDSLDLLQRQGQSIVLCAPAPAPKRGVPATERLDFQSFGVRFSDS